jgi:Peptidase M50B-like
MSSSQATLSAEAAVAVGLASFGAVAAGVGWQVIRHGTVMAHEGAHAVFGSLLSRNISGIELNSDATGGTMMNPGGCLGSIVIGFAGYAGPSLFGLGAAWLIHLGQSVAVLWVTLFLLAVLLIGLNRSYGCITVLLVGGLVYVICRYASTGAQVVGAYAITWLLLLSGVRRVLEVGSGSDDGAKLTKLTHLPRLLWFLLWLAVTVGAVAVGGELLVTPA